MPKLNGILKLADYCIRKCNTICSLSFYITFLNATCTNNKIINHRTENLHSKNTLLENQLPVHSKMLLDFDFVLEAALGMVIYIWVIDQAWGQDGWILAKFFFCVFMDRGLQSINTQKRTRSISSHLDRTSLVNKGFIIWDKMPKHD